MSDLVHLAETSMSPMGGPVDMWAIVSYVEVGQTTAIVYFTLLGATQIDTASGTNLKLARVGTLNPGDKIMVTRFDNGAWVIVDKVVPIEGIGVE